MYPSIHSSDDASCSDGTLPSGACVRYGCLDSRALNYDSRANRASTSSRFACVMPARPKSQRDPFASHPVPASTLKRRR